ncbi:MAG: hypothetical protein PUA94_07705, partial [Bacteroidales bacterium]|nr:hypothetical protein [Bacteroidales bacterium]
MKKVYVMACGATLALMATACSGNKAQQNDTDTVAVDTTIVAEVEVADSDTVAVVAVEEEVATTPAKKAPKKEGKKEVKKEVKVPGADQATVEAAQNAIKTA